MGLINNIVDKSKLEPGDHIYTYRTAYTYAHHGIYLGRLQVIHFTPELNSKTGFSSGICSSSSIRSPCPNIHTIPCCATGKLEGGVVLSCLDCFLQNDSLHRYSYGVWSVFFITRLRGGSCTTAKSDPSELVLERAKKLLEKGFGKFDVCGNNCEDFALYCKTGLLIVQIGAGTSGQASSLAGASWSVSAIFSKLLMSSPVSMAAGTVGMYNLSRYRADVGVRTDVLKVEVDELLSIKLKFEELFRVQRKSSTVQKVSKNEVTVENCSLPFVPDSGYGCISLRERMQKSI